eukprot:gnl/Ergobibamus_cyprinoides/320.p3 GENE.gnl/Ergobibamus_cyprinoides/320~~gnl/Ergobibamus_cyprinoides/320.p3  ORF type:complete len:103 (+),score=43.59 gnl/Ergobibamus_cyprinoides/320:787-1095(+)
MVALRARLAETELITVEELEALSDKALLRRDDVHEFVVAQVEAFGKRAGLRGFERPKENLFLTAVDWTADNELLTPSLKKARGNLARQFAPQLNKMLVARRE